MGALADFRQEYYSTPLGDGDLPIEITGNYTISACLKESEHKRVYLILRKTDGARCILKCLSAASQEKPEEEYRMHCNLTHEGLASAFGFIQNGDHSYLIREYIEGNTITDLVEMSKEGRLSDDLLLNITRQLCRVLRYLHSQTPPIIHRDIKPDNIIFDNNGRLKLIDFGISRRFSNERDKDTVIMGTEFTAPPEQYGFQQTDARSDIYSLGILMFYMATGSFDIKEIGACIISKHIGRCIKRCTRFAPEDRYSSVRQIETGLLLEGTLLRHIKLVKAAAVVFLAAGAFISGSVLTMAYYKGSAEGTKPQTSGEYQDNTAPLDIYSDQYSNQYKNQPEVMSDGGEAPQPVSDASGEYHFTSSLIEAAVRKELGKSATDTVTLGDLKQMTRLYICGQQIYNEWYELFTLGAAQHMNPEYNTTGLYRMKGDIESLEDISHMVNLRELALYNQNISDLTPLKELTYLETLGLGSNYIADISPLQELVGLRTLNISDNELKNDDLQVVRELPFLERLDIGATRITSIYEIRDINLKQLSVAENLMADFDGLEEIISLESLTASGVNYMITKEAVLKISTLINLKELWIVGGDGFDLSLLSDMTELQTLDLVGNKEFDLNRLNNPSLTNIRLDFVDALDLSGIEKCINLQYLSVRYSNCTDLSPLLQLPYIEELTVDSSQLEQVHNQLGTVAFELNVLDDR